MKKRSIAIHYTGSIFLLLSCIVICLTGCGEQGPSVSISASPETISFDESTILTWSSHDADSVSINNGVGTVGERGTTVVKPYRTTTYMISAVNADGKAESSVTVKVKYTDPEPIINLSANPTSIYPGESSVLTWSITNAYTLTIDNGIGSMPLDYSMTVSPNVTTKYTFVAFGQGGEAMSSVTINVMDNPPTAKISANPTSIKSGEIAVLEWQYTNADTVTIEPDIGDGTQISSVEVSPLMTTTYTIKAVGPGGTATDNVTVFVDIDDPDKIFVEIQANPMNIHYGDIAELSWTTNNAERVWIEPEIGDVDLIGTFTVMPEETTTYVIHAEKNGNEAQDSVTINVAISDPPTVSITAEPSTIKPNETTTLSWESQNAESVEIDQGIGIVGSSGSKAITLLETTTFTILATGPGGSKTASVTINVEDSFDAALGNQQFTIEKAIQVDPLASYRLNINLSNNLDTLLPDKVDWSNKVPAAQNQKTTASDNAWAMVYYLKSFQESVSKQYPVNEKLFSPMFTYVLQCQNETEPWDLIKTWKMTHRYGCTLWTSLPFEDLDGFMDDIEKEAYASYKLNDTLLEDALKYRMGMPVMLTDLDQIRMMLTQTPVVLAINHFDPQLIELPSIDQNFLTYLDRTDLAHSVLCIGYNNNQFDTGALKIINSWGKEWAQDGLTWIKYADVDKIVVSAMAFHALPTDMVNNATIPQDKPERPRDVNASIDLGPYVDIQWTHVDNARYYQIYRAPAASQSTVHEVYDYEYIGTAMHSPYRDFPSAGDHYYYAVVAVNEFGFSEHLNHQNDMEAHVARGMAYGKSLKTPSLSVESEPASGQTEFSVSGIDSDTSRLQVFVSRNEYGPWQSFGWIKPSSQFVIDWYKDNTWTGSQPYVRVVSENQLMGFSMASRTVKVPSAIVPQNQVATMNSLIAQPTDMKTIQLIWSLTGDQVDFLDIWRSHNILSSSPTWIKLDTVSSALDSYHDTTAVAGINYQYAVHCVFEGISGIGQSSNVIQLPLNQPNLRIVHVEYDTGALMEPFEMELTIDNNGNSTIEDYSFNVMAYNWATNEQVVCLEDRVSKYPELKHPMTSGNQHIFSITFDLPDQLNSGVLFSWFVLIDSKYEINEAYESDNVYWAQKMCWLEMEQ
jgi:uncharacterized cupredoxin-like copper-binding protein